MTGRHVDETRPVDFDPRLSAAAARAAVTLAAEYRAAGISPAVAESVARVEAPAMLAAGLAAEHRAVGLPGPVSAAEHRGRDITLVTITPTSLPWPPRRLRAGGSR